MSWLHDKVDEGAQYVKLLGMLRRVSNYLSAQSAEHPEDKQIYDLFQEVYNYLRRPV